MNESNTYKRQIQIVFKNSGQGTLSTGTNDHTYFLQRLSHTLQFISFHVAKTARKIKVYSISSQVPQLVKTLGEERECSLRETWVQSLGWEDPLEKGMATHSSILSWKIPWTMSMGSQRVRRN